MMSPIPTLNKADSMIIDHESQRSISCSSVVSQVVDSLEGTAFFSHKEVPSTGFRESTGKRVVIGARNTYDGGGMNTGSKISQVEDQVQEATILADHLLTVVSDNQRRAHWCVYSAAIMDTSRRTAIS